MALLQLVQRGGKVFRVCSAARRQKIKIFTKLIQICERTRPMDVSMSRESRSAFSRPIVAASGGVLPG